jgi:hypothetical protein
MKVRLLIIIVLIINQTIAQNCKTKIVSSSTKSLLGVQTVNLNIMNLHDQAFDRIDYKVTSYDVYGNKLGTEDFFWQPGLVTHPIKNGETLHDIQKSKLSGATQIKVEIKKVHYVNGKTCGG